jgi:hypothetical protein
VLVAEEGILVVVAVVAAVVDIFVAAVLVGIILVEVMAAVVFFAAFLLRPPFRAPLDAVATAPSDRIQRLLEPVRTTSPPGTKAGAPGRGTKEVASGRSAIRPAPGPAKSAGSRA